MPRLKITKTTLAQKLGIARSTLYYQQKKSKRDDEEKQKIVKIMTVHKSYGHRRISCALAMNHKKVLRIMKKFHLKPLLMRTIRHCKPNDQKRPETKVINILKTICPLRPTIVWAGDFTYLWFQDRFWYIATVIDVYTRELIGWHIANHHTVSLIMHAFQDALQRTRSAPRYFHSDQGSEYVSDKFTALLGLHGVIPSHSKKSSPWQNGFQESFYNNFKLELGEMRRFATSGHMIEAIHEHMKYYNTFRIHTALKMPPVRYRQLCMHAISTSNR